MSTSHNNSPQSSENTESKSAKDRLKRWVSENPKKAVAVITMGSVAAIGISYSIGQTVKNHGSKYSTSNTFDEKLEVNSSNEPDGEESIYVETGPELSPSHIATPTEVEISSPPESVCTELDIDERAALVVTAINTGNSALIDGCADSGVLQRIEEGPLPENLQTPEPCVYNDLGFIACMTQTDTGLPVELQFNSGSAGESLYGWRVLASSPDGSLEQLEYIP